MRYKKINSNLATAKHFYLNVSFFYSSLKTTVSQVYVHYAKLLTSAGLAD